MNIKELMNIVYPLVFIDDTGAVKIISDKKSALNCIEHQFLTELDVYLFDSTGQKLKFISRDQRIIDISTTEINERSKMVEMMKSAARYLSYNSLDRGLFTEIPDKATDLISAFSEIEGKVQSEGFLSFIFKIFK